MDQEREGTEIEDPSLCAFTNPFPIVPGSSEISTLLLREHGDAYERIGFATSDGYKAYPLRNDKFGFVSKK